MRSVLLSTAVRLLLPLLLLFSLFLLVRGHNEPGGGFVGGLVAAAGLSLHALAQGVAASRRVLRVPPRQVIAAGLLTALAAGALPLALGRPFLTGLWTAPDAVLGRIGTPLLFDAGVYLVVAGTALLIVFNLMEE